MSDKTQPVTVGELVDALASYPRDALVFTGEAGTGCGTVIVEDDGWRTVGDCRDADGKTGFEEESDE
ncbi:hypothetical protein [Mycetocola saprophilus]|uniref:hypothetical protein n=1 Tax=Mycetocola saprophilus TaxID=76636 RepID=UPI0004C063BF|nr:hypothetical protein [Mycetocola saprophilus]